MNAFDGKRSSCFFSKDLVCGEFGYYCPAVRKRTIREEGEQVGWGEAWPLRMRNESSSLALRAILLAQCE